MTFEEYQNEAMESAIYPREMGVVYPVLGLAGETGEVAEKVKKTIRDFGGELDEERRHLLALEAGDILWYLAALARELGISLDEIAGMNLAKIRSRRERNALQGSGDLR